jgi:hypothetical protein
MRDGFDPASAIQVVSLPESTVGNNKMSTPSTSPSVSPSETLTPASYNKPSDTSTIIGVTVLGSVLGLGLIAALILYIRKKREFELPSVFVGTRVTPNKATATAAGLTNAPLSSGHSSVKHGQRGPPPSPAVFQFGHVNGTPWSPPLPSSTPSRAITPMSAQSLLSTHNYGGRYRRGDNSTGYQNSSSRPGTVDLLESSSSLGSMRCVRSRQADYGHVLISLI